MKKRTDNIAAGYGAALGPFIQSDFTPSLRAQVQMLFFPRHSEAIMDSGCSESVEIIRSERQRNREKPRTN